MSSIVLYAGLFFIHTYRKTKIIFLVNFKQFLHFSLRWFQLKKNPAKNTKVLLEIRKKTEQSSNIIIPSEKKTALIICPKSFLTYFTTGHSHYGCCVNKALHSQSCEVVHFLVQKTIVAMTWKKIKMCLLLKEVFIKNKKSVICLIKQKKNNNRRRKMFCSENSSQ